MTFRGVTKECLLCGQPYMVPLCRKDKARFCSQRCRGLWYVGPKSPAWRGGQSYNNRAGYKRLKQAERVLQRKINGCHTECEWQVLKASYDNTCLACGKREPNVALTRDHIVPLSLGGNDLIDNIQPLCFSCNCKKSKRIISYRDGWRVTCLAAVPREFLKPNHSKIRQAVEQTKADTRIRGIAVYATTQHSLFS